MSAFSGRARNRTGNSTELVNFFTRVAGHALVVRRGLTIIPTLLELVHLVRPISTHVVESLLVVTAAAEASCIVVITSSTSSPESTKIASAEVIEMVLVAVITEACVKVAKVTISHARSIWIEIILADVP